MDTTAIGGETRLGETESFPAQSTCYTMARKSNIRRNQYMELSEIKQELEKITSRVEDFRGSL